MVDSSGRKPINTPTNQPFNRYPPVPPVYSGPVAVTPQMTGTPMHLDCQGALVPDPHARDIDAVRHAAA